MAGETVREPIKFRWEDDPLMMPALLGCINWAMGKPEIIEAFRADTGNRWEPARTGFDRMIDTATGVDREFMQQFVTWVEDNIFGLPDEPLATQGAER